MSLTIDVSGLVATSKRLAELRTNGADAIMRTVAVTMGGEVRERIHEKGENSEGSQIGTYSVGYLKTRKKFNRGTSKSVILSLTGQMENDFVAVAENPLKVEGGYALGFNNPTNEKKASYNDKRYGAAVYKLQKEELKKVRDIVEYETNLFLNDK